MNKKTAALIEQLIAERNALTVRMAELDEVFCAGNGSDELEAEFYAADARVRAIRGEVHEANRPRGRICSHTAQLVAENRD